MTCSQCSRALAQLVPILGFVYVLSNPSIPDLVKIGFTESAVDERVKELSSSTSVPQAYMIEAYFWSSEPRADEARVHKELADRRMRGREFFKATPIEAIAVLRRVIGREPSFVRTPVQVERTCQHCCYIWIDELVHNFTAPTYPVCGGQVRPTNV